MDLSSTSEPENLAYHKALATGGRGERALTEAMGRMLGQDRAAAGKFARVLTRLLSPELRPPAKKSALRARTRVSTGLVRVRNRAADLFLWSEDRRYGWDRTDSGIYLTDWADVDARRADLVSQPLAIDLFAGPGGFSLGFKQAGWHVIAANECDADGCVFGCWVRPIQERGPRRDQLSASTRVFAPALRRGRGSRSRW